MPPSLNRLSSSSAAYKPPVSPPDGTRVIAPLRDKVFGVLVSAATFRGDEILLLQRSMEQKFMPGAWSIPAGKIMPKEGSLEHAVLRELYEEAGIKGKVLHNLGMCWFESNYYEQPLHHIQFNFVVRTDDGDVELRDGSNMAYLWMPFDQIDQPPVPIDEFTRSVMTRAIDYIRSNEISH
jgi:8-oxo-dGTP diphosphatase